MKKAEIDAIERLKKANEIGHFEWSNCLREGLYTNPEPPLVMSQRLMSTLNTSPRFSKVMLKHSTKPLTSGTGLRDSRYFKDKVEAYEKKIEEPLNFFDYKHLKVVGKDKLLMEYRTAQRIGAETITFKPAEEDNETIESNYSPRVLY